jgi:hypothetical protein
MSKMALGTLLLFPNYVDAPFQKIIKALVWICLVNPLVLFNKCL